MILTLTVNPAIDRNVTADRLVFEDRAHILSTSESPGGRGINASCVIASFGGLTRAIVTCGGASGSRFEELLGCCHVPVDLVKIKNDIRTNLTITDKRGLTVKLNEAGPRMDKAEIERLEEAVREKMEGAQWLMLCGSLPPGVPADFYARLIESAHKKKVKTLLDTDGEALRQGLQARPEAVAPSQPEAERLLDTALLTRAHFLDAARKIGAMGAHAVVLSLGSRGAVGVDGKRTWEASPPRIDAVCPIGAGDALAAAFTWALAAGKSFDDALRWGVAAGSASAKLPGVTFASLAQTREVYERVEVREA
ncbi:MAG: 1-phosphofructokinase family hexose kinase [Acidobacteria bacterium]|nr:1-phosphofructokinase family hexose kinase [Acidobacteriota bacterium]